MDEPNNDIDTETLQAQIDLSMAYAQNLITSWLPTSSSLTQSSSRAAEAETELQALLRRPPRLGVGAPIPETSAPAQARLKRQLEGGKKHGTEVMKNGVPSTTAKKEEEEDSAEKSRVPTIRKRQRVDPFEPGGKKKHKKEKEREREVAMMMTTMMTTKEAKVATAAEGSRKQLGTKKKKKKKTVPTSEGRWQGREERVVLEAPPDGESRLVDSHDINILQDEDSVMSILPSLDESQKPHQQKDQDRVAEPLRSAALSGPGTASSIAAPNQSRQTSLLFSARKPPTTTVPHVKAARPVSPPPLLNLTGPPPIAPENIEGPPPKKRKRKKKKKKRAGDQGVNNDPP
ncbi:hypothetical protein B0F90DRAFT_1914976 [Multifurca ochricompacta]|uniref:Uncharacterized protein n=1 Tax=Multifurca ochricompacta TaxID=376703 RepID=A0AAD4MAI6_9AGAM|nr:hypothetical protein B0F90DRAFT_1914976 [Multifurca ochricompacta]